MRFDNFARKNPKVVSIDHIRSQTTNENLYIRSIVNHTGLDSVENGHYTCDVFDRSRDEILTFNDSAILQGPRYSKSNDGYLMSFIPSITTEAVRQIPDDTIRIQAQSAHGYRYGVHF